MEIIDVNKYSTIVQTAAHPKMSSKYGFIPTTKPIEVLANSGWYPSKVLESRSRVYSGFQKHLVRFRNEKYSVSSEGFPEIVVGNAHQGSGTFNIMMGYYRLVCSNGLFVGNTIETHRVMHRGYTDAKVDVAIQLLTSNIDNVLTKVEQYKSIEVGYVDQLDYVKQVTDEMEIKLKDQSTILIPRRSEDGNGHKNLWQLLNVTQENIMNGNYTYLDVNNKERRAKKIVNIDRTINFNKTLWNVADNYIQ